MSRVMRRGLSLILAISLLWIVHPFKANAQSSPKYGGVLRIIRFSGPGTPFGWPIKTRGLDSLAASPCLEPLMRQEWEGHYVPILATDMSIAPDKGSITFKLRKGVKFHDGTDWNAEAAKFNLQAYIDNKKPEAKDWKSIDVIDNYTICIHLTKFENTGLLDLVGRKMVSPAAYKTKGEEWLGWHPVGTGPFEFESFQRDVNCTYKKFEGYWQKGKPYLDGVEWLYIKDPMTQTAAMKAGEADVQSVTLGKNTRDMEAVGLNVVYKINASLNLIPDSGNTDSPYADQRVRNAVSHALDREAFVKALGYGFWKVQYQMPIDDNPAYIKGFKGRAYDPERAKKFLEEAGYPKGFETMLMPMPGTPPDVFAVIQSYLGAVGIKVKIEQVPMGKFMSTRTEGWNNGLLLQPFAVWQNFGKTMQYYISSKSSDFPVLKRFPEIDTLIDEAVATVQPDVNLLQRAVRMMDERTVTIPVYSSGGAYALQKYVKDAAFLKLANWNDWVPEDAWMDK
ncbi:MAG: ABC transporter substrate-binding protein [Deltaproteobacteria bacterium]|nr:ABC transporter substrate-binding protein [Deltaproteobacteria bacterium]